MAAGSVSTIDAETTTSAELDDSGEVHNSIAEIPDADAHFIECCAELAIEASGDGKGSTVKTGSGLPMAAGLKGLNTATNATVLATLSTLGRSVNPGPGTDIPHLDTCRMSVHTAHGVGITTTEVFDDAAASMIRGIVVTDNTESDLVAHDEVDWDVLVRAPPERAYSADADMSRCKNAAPMADLVADLVFEGRYARAMAINDLAFSVVLDFPTNPVVEAIPITDGVSLSRTGSGVVAVNDRIDPERIEELWDTRGGETWLMTARIGGTRIQ